LKEHQQITFIADLIVIVTVILFLTQTLDCFNYPKAAIIALGSFSLFASLIVYARYPFRRQEVNWVEYLIFTFIFLISILASANNLQSFTTIWGSFSRGNGLLVKAALLLIALIYFRFSTRNSISRFFRVGTLILIVEILYGAAQLIGLDPIPWNNPYKNIFATAGNPNFAAALFAILVVMHFRFLFTARSLRVKIFMFCLVLLGTYMSYMTKSIQGVLTILAGVFLLFFIAILRKSKSTPRIVVGSSTLIFFALPFVLGVFNTGPLKQFLYQETLSIRMHYWRVALRIIQEHPIAGVGVDRYGDYYRLYRESGFVSEYGPGLVSTNAHNVALQWGTDLGVIGTLIYVLLYLIPMWMYIKRANFRLRNKLDDFDFLFVAYSAFYLQSLISISQLSVTVLGFALLGICLSQVRIKEEVFSEPLSRKSRQLKSSFVGIGTWWFIFSLLLAPFLTKPITQDLNLRRALQLPGTAQGITDLSVRSEAIYKASLPLITDQDYLGSAVQNLFASGNAQTGVDLAKLALEKNPFSWVAYRSLFDAYSQSNLHSEALEIGDKLIGIDPLNYNILYELAEEALKLNNLQLAKSYATKVSSFSPPSSEVSIKAKNILEQIGD
jgi:O-antigen ligase